MPKGLRILPALVIAGMLALPVAGRAEPDANTVVAKVNGTEITLGHMIVAYASLPAQYKQMDPRVLYGAILDQLVQQEALRQAHGPDMPFHAQLSLENETRSLLAGAEVENIMKDAADEAAIKAAYDEKYGDGFGGEEFNASHILVETKEEAADIRKQLEDGADFAELAKSKSIGPSGPSGGALDWISPDRLVPEFADALKKMQPGEISEPVQTEYGWHIIELKEKRRAKAPELDQVKGQIARELREKAVEARIAELTAAADVERPEVEGLDPNVLTDLGMVRN